LNLGSALVTAGTLEATGPAHVLDGAQNGGLIFHEQLIGLRASQRDHAATSAAIDKRCLRTGCGNPFDRASETFTGKRTRQRTNESSEDETRLEVCLRDSEAGIRSEKSCFSGLDIWPPTQQLCRDAGGDLRKGCLKWRGSSPKSLVNLSGGQRHDRREVIQDNLPFELQGWNLGISRCGL